MKKTSKIILGITLSLVMILLTSCRRIDFSQPWSMDRESIRVGKAILNALSEHDEEAFSDLFCKRVKEQEGFSEQVKQAMLFFEGEIADFPNEGDLTSSGEQECNGGKVTYMQLDDVIREIKTNSGKVYSIFYYCYIVNTEEPDEEGVVKITIESGYRKCEVGGWE